MSDQRTADAPKREDWIVGTSESERRGDGFRAMGPWRATEQEAETDLPRRERATHQPLGATIEGRLVVTALCDLRATGKDRLTPHAVEMLERAINLIEGRDCFPKEGA